MAGALIVLAELGEADFAWLDSLRRKHFPPERNRVPAHLTMFHALPPSAEAEVRRSLSRAACERAPEAMLAGLMDLGAGVAFRIRSERLDSLRSQLEDEFRGLLTAQDAGRWTAHITVQNKVEPRVSRKLLEGLRATFEPRSLTVRGLRLVRYSDGDWEPLAGYPFRSLR